MPLKSINILEYIDFHNEIFSYISLPILIATLILSISVSGLKKIYYSKKILTMKKSENKIFRNLKRRYF